VSLVIRQHLPEQHLSNLKNGVSRHSVHLRHDEPIRKLQITGRRPAMPTRATKLRISILLTVTAGVLRTLTLVLIPLLFFFRR
jgi:hypothetical protein